MTKYAFVLEERHRYAGWSGTRKVAAVSAPVDELTARLRPWALEIITGERFDDGEYTALLVELRQDGEHRTGLLVSVEDIFWFAGEEYAPVSSGHA